MPLAVNANQWFTESIYGNWCQTYKIDEVLYEEKTDFHHMIIFKNGLYGTVLALDGVIQTTEKDEFVYHEMITHVPMLQHGNAQKVLIIGGGDGGSLREVLKHKTVKKAVLIDIDTQVIELSKKYLPNHSQGAFNDPRAEIIIADGCKFVKETQEKFDVIICDTTDPIGAGKVLFTEEFYADCAKLLTKNGVFVNQNEVPYMCDTINRTCNKLKPFFSTVKGFLAPVPTYIGGYMAFGFATNNDIVTLQELEQRISNIDGELKYYTPEMHKASFALPNKLKQSLYNER
ncbi:MAG: polyamine aminopropyltransferase [Candidatus Dependentiae bacterium]